MTANNTAAPKKTRAKAANGSKGKVRVTQTGTGQKAVLPENEVTPDLLEALKTTKPKRGPGRPKKVQPVKTTEEIIADIEREIANFKPITDLVAQMQHVVDILKGDS